MAEKIDCKLLLEIASHFELASDEIDTGDDEGSLRRSEEDTAAILFASIDTSPIEQKNRDRIKFTNVRSNKKSPLTL